MELLVFCSINIHTQIMLLFIFKKNLITINKGINTGFKFNYLKNLFKRTESVIYLFF